MISKLVDWFVPDMERLGRTEAELARVFVFTHVFGPLIAQPLWIYLAVISPRASFQLYVLAIAICSFWALPFLLRATANIWLSALASFQGLAATSLFGSYYFGGFSSPFLPWLVVSLLLGLFYLSKNVRLVLTLFVLDILLCLLMAWRRELPQTVPLEDLSILGWLSIGSATVYMTWMALYYSKIVGFRSEFEAEAVRSRAMSVELERARAVAETTNQARARFFAKMSHELRTPLNAIIGYSEILLEEMQDLAVPNDERTNDVRRINAAGKHLRSLVSSVLDTDQIEQDLVRVEIEEFTVGSFCEEVMANAQPLIEKNDNLFVLICPQRDQALSTDKTKLRQVVLNLLSNAGKFTSNGTVKLELHVQPSPHGDLLRIIVTDTGIGIASDTLPRLFTDYEQADASTMVKYGGTGLGLALSRRLCILLGGEIEVVSRLGAGTRFIVTVPTRLVDEVEVRTPSAHEETPAPRPALTFA